jgi:hypothetical protein
VPEEEQQEHTGDEREHVPETGGEVARLLDLGDAVRCGDVVGRCI